jgi:hypothetical protein
MIRTFAFTTMETPGHTRTDPLLTESISAVKSAKVDNLRKCCENLGLVVGSSGRRNQRVKHDYVTAILTHVSNKSDVQKIIITTTIC